MKNSNLKKGLILLKKAILNREKKFDKYTAELDFWRNNFVEDHKEFRNSWYEYTMLAMAQEKNSDFLKGKIVADFGCGPRGSLQWIDNAFLKIGIDALADTYFDEFFESAVKHNMVYLRSTENTIPLPSDFVDIMFSMNAIDHVNDFPIICNEIIRVIKPGGELIASFNLNEPITATEPQLLTEKIIDDHLLKKINIQSYRISKRLNQGYQYQGFLDGQLSYKEGEEAFLWIRAIKNIL